MRRRISTLVGIAVISAAVAGLLAAFPAPAKADAGTEAYLSCTAMSGFSIELPGWGTTRGSNFAYRIDGGPWHYTNWFYTAGGLWWEYANYKWQFIANGATSALIYGFYDEAQHLVEVWEKRIWSSSDGWHNLGSCYASSYHYGGGVIGVGH